MIERMTEMRNNYGSGMGEKGEAAIAAHQAWLKEARKKAVRYEEDPIVEVFQMRENVYSIYAPCTHDGGDVWCHLIVGETKALLWDTAFGIGNLKALTDRLSGGKPLIVVNSHCHGDHSLGNSQFEEVYCHKYDAPMLEAQMYPEFWAEFNKVTNHSFFTDDDIIPFHPYKVSPCENHHIFRLGEDHELELIWLPGHASGESMLLDKKNRILFAGDAITDLFVMMAGEPKAYEQHPEVMNIHSCANELKAVAARENEYDSVFLSHGRLDVSPNIVTDMLELCLEVMDNPDVYDFTMQRRGKECKVRFHGLTGLCYTDNRI